MPHVHHFFINRINRTEERLADITTYKNLNFDPADAIRNVSYPLLIPFTTPKEEITEYVIIWPTWFFMNITFCTASTNSIYLTSHPMWMWHTRSSSTSLFYGFPKTYLPSLPLLLLPPKVRCTSFFYGLSIIYIPYLWLPHLPTPSHLQPILSTCDSPISQPWNFDAHFI